MSSVHKKKKINTKNGAKMRLNFCAERFLRKFLFFFERERKKRVYFHFIIALSVIALSILLCIILQCEKYLRMCALIVFFPADKVALCEVHTGNLVLFASIVVCIQFSFLIIIWTKRFISIQLKVHSNDSCILFFFSFSSHSPHLNAV